MKNFWLWRPNRSRAFTLIELLVVITIIVVLLAMLAPALDNAIYQTELAVCAAQQKTIATGVNVYASSNKGVYPNRGLGTGVTIDLKIGINPVSSSEGRPYLKSMFGLDIFNDPMVKAVDFSIEGTTASDRVLGCYSMWWGVKWTGEQPMRKLGDRFTWTSTGPGGVTKVNKFDLLVSDLDYLNNGGPQWWSSHPDKLNVMHNQVNQNEGLGPSQIYTLTMWLSNANRGAADFNYAHADNSVERLETVVWRQNGNAYVPDERMAAVPEDLLNGNNYPQYNQQAPPAR